MTPHPDRCRCWYLPSGTGVAVRDTRAWDPVSGLCGRCELPYRLRWQGTLPAGRPVRAEDLRPTDTSDEVDGE